ncbi:MAG: DUF3810 domain-containing protein [Brotaphodocola sp.]
MKSENPGGNKVLAGIFVAGATQSTFLYGGARDSGHESLESECVTQMKEKLHQYFLAGAILLILTAVLQLAARRIPGFATWYAHHIYPVLVGTIGRFSGIFPISLAELGLYLLMIGVVIYIILNYKKPLRVVSRIFCICMALLFSYTVNCGINYFASPFSAYAGIETELYTKEQLKELCRYLVEQVNANVSEVHYMEQKQEWKQESIEAMRHAGEKFSCLGGFYPIPKELMISELLSVQQLCGIYSPFTIEANFNGDMPDYNIPHTMCHELSHLKGFMREDEANFIGYLACIMSENPSFRYSGYLTGWVYAGNALAKTDMKSFMELRNLIDERAIEDMEENNAFWNRYEGGIAEAANQVNDAYLKVNQQADGVKSYGRMVDLMLAYHRISDLIK